jgi:hypothetical protein
VRSFDPEEARRAWRQVARMRGQALGRSGGDSYVSAQRIAIGILVAVLAVLGAAHLAGDDEANVVAAEVAALPSAAVDVRASEPASGTVPQWTAKLDTSTRDDTTARTDPAIATAKPTLETASPQPTPRLAVEQRPAVRVAPHGTGQLTAKAFSRIPVSRYDRAPVGAIAPSGLHIDRISIANGYEESRCKGAKNGFAVGRDAEIHVCLRVVHLRQQERLVVRWEKDGRVVRRTRLSIPPYHAYRTRAGLRLRSGYEGRWRVRIMTPKGGRQLATASFTVDA